MLSRLPMENDVFKYGTDDVDEKLIDYGIEMTLNTLDFSGLNESEIKDAQRNDPSLTTIINNSQLIPKLW